MPSYLSKNVITTALQALTLLLASSPLSMTMAADPLWFIENSSVPGGITMIRLDTEQFPTTGDAPKIMWNGRAISAVEHDQSYTAFVGIPLSTKAGRQTLELTSSSGQKSTLTFNINEKAYEEQRLVIKNKRKVNPAPVDMERITKENKRLKEVKSYKAQRMIAESFDWPLAGIMSSPFGLKRFYNDQARRPHGGIDIAAPEGTPIFAPADGVVVETGDYFFNGNSVFIEHGLGLQTFYAHMSRIDVQAGDRITKGQVLGAVGQTGRVTGPHLHWSVGLNATWVNPLLLLETDLPPPAAQ